MESKKYSLAEVIKSGINARLIDLHTALPGEVQSYNSTLQTVDVKVSIDRYINGKKVSYPILQSVPVVFPRTGKYSISFPLESGDGVLLIFNERNLDNWYGVGSGQEPIDGRKFDINDAVAIPGLFPSLGVMIPPPQQAIEIRGDKLFIGDPLGVLTPIVTTGTGPGTPAGKPVQIPLATKDLVSIISALIDLVDGAFYGIGPAGPAGGGGGIDPVSSSALQGLKADLESLKP